MEASSGNSYDVTGLTVSYETNIGKEEVREDATAEAATAHGDDDVVDEPIFNRVSTAWKLPEQKQSKMGEFFMSSTPLEASCVREEGGLTQKSSPWSGSGSRTPVLSQDLLSSVLDCPTPGLDALYINSLKDGDWEEEFSEEEEVGPERRRPKNPFIDDECGVGDEEDVGETFARGGLEDGEGGRMEPVKVLKRPTRAFPQPPEGKRR